MATTTCGLSSQEGYREAGIFWFLKVTPRYLNTVALVQIRRVRNQHGWSKNMLKILCWSCSVSSTFVFGLLLIAGTRCESTCISSAICALVAKTMAPNLRISLLTWQTTQFKNKIGTKIQKLRATCGPSHNSNLTLVRACMKITFSHRLKPSSTLRPCLCGTKSSGETVPLVFMALTLCQTATASYGF